MEGSASFIHKRMIYVGNLSEKISASDLYNHFIDCGDIVKIPYKKALYAFVEFKYPECAELAIKVMNLSILKDKRIIVNEFHTKNRSKFVTIDFNGEVERERKLDAKNENQLYENNLHPYEYQRKAGEKNNTKNFGLEVKILIHKPEYLFFAKNLKLRLSMVDISSQITLNRNFMESSVLNQIYNDGYHFVAFVNGLNIKFNSFSFITLQSTHEQHLNIPFEEGIKMICKFHNENSTRQSKNPVPDDISYFISKLMIGDDLTAFQYKVLLNFLKIERNQQVKIEVEKFEDYKVLDLDYNLRYEKLFKKVMNALKKVMDEKGILKTYWMMNKN